MSDVTLEVDNASKWFGGVVAVSDVTFRVGPGVTALLGPNGAGKSTILRLLCGMTAPSRGGVRVLGRNPRDDISVYRRLGLVPQQEAVIERLRAVEFVRAAAELSGVTAPDGAARQSLAAVELDPDDHRPLRTYSKGMRQRVKVAAGIVHGPEVVILDEPLDGLDPRQRLRMIELFRHLGSEGRTVLVSSHVLEEVARFGSGVLVMAQGRLVAEGDYREIRELMDDRPHRLRVVATDARRLAAGLLDAEAVVGVSVSGAGGGEVLLVDTDDVQAFRRSVARVARDRKVRLLEVVPLDDDLESVFRYLVGRRG